jgi:hypothetical protein
MFTHKRNVLTIAAVLATMAMAGGVTAVEFSAHQAPSQPAVVQTAPPAAPAFQEVGAGELA